MIYMSSKIYNLDLSFLFDILNKSSYRIDLLFKH